MRNLEELLIFLEENIDEAHIKKVEKLHLDAMAYREVPYLPLTTVVTPDVTLYPYSEAFDDPEKMLFNELLCTLGRTGTYNSVLVKDHFPLQVRSNHGIGILASLFGATCRIVKNSMPWVDHMDLAEIKRALSRGIPDINTGLCRKVFETHQYYMEALKPYPKCARYIRITQPDLQGPFDVAHILVGGDIYYWVNDIYGTPEMVHELLTLITQVTIDFVRSLAPYVNDRAGENAIYIHGALAGGNTLLKDDCAIINLSQEMYMEFSKPYNERILKELGGGSIHFCGPSRNWTAEVLDSPYLRSVNYGNPEMQDLSVVMDYWAPRKISNVFWGDALRLKKLDIYLPSQIRAAGIKTGMSLVAIADSIEQAKGFMDEHIAASA